MRAENHSWVPLASRAARDDVGELARMFNAERRLGVGLAGRADRKLESPHAVGRNGSALDQPVAQYAHAQQALLYPGIGLLETTNLSVGRGTDTPFELVGAPWIDPWKLAQRLGDGHIAGVRFVPIRFTPASSKHAGERCGGVRMQITRRDAVRPLRLGIELACAVRDLFGEDWKLEQIDRLLCDARVLELLKSGATPRQIEGAYQAELADFVRRRERYLIYK